MFWKVLQACIAQALWSFLNATLIPVYSKKKDYQEPIAVFNLESTSSCNWNAISISMEALNFATTS